MFEAAEVGKKLSKQAYEERDIHLLHIKKYRIYDVLKNNPRGQRAVEMLEQVRLVFPGDLCAWVPRALYEKGKSARQWVVEFPAGAIWVFPQQGSGQG